MRSCLLFILLCSICSVASGYSIALDIPPQSTGNAAVQLAVQDVKQLLETGCNCSVSYGTTGDIILRIPAVDPQRRKEPSFFAKRADVPLFPYPDHDFAWRGRQKGTQQLLELSAPTGEGVANGLYALLQEKLGFRFYHPREMIIGDLRTWPLPAEFEFSGFPAFEKKGFHLHTQHPLELTEALHNHRLGETGLSMIFEYIDWLARNGQNFFEFCLLEDIDLRHWPEYARQFTDYAHARGILCSVDLSLHMVQQKAFKLFRFPPKSLRPFKKQINRRLDALMRANWDFVNMEFSIAEFVGGLEKLRLRLRNHIVAKLKRDYPEVKLLGRQHVVKPEDEIGGSGSHDILSDTTEPERGLLVHTVMSYGLDWEKAPVYELENLNHMKAVLDSQMDIRECWFYPESAYWITFDNSIPLLQLNYLKARFEDIQLMKKKEVPGHITFSSGWEWGYWLVDWSIARWSWNYTWNKETQKQSPVSAFELLMNDPEICQLLNQMIELEYEELVVNEGMKYITASTLTDELPPGINKQFMPRPDFSYQWLTREASSAEVDSIENMLKSRLSIRGKYNPLFLRLDSLITPEMPPQAMEIFLAIRMMRERANHRFHMFQHLICTARKRLGESSAYKKEDFHLGRAEYYRGNAIKIVRLMERRYRYPVNRIAGKHPGYTAYAFGYLWPAHDLHFWEREEEQARKGKWSPFFMNIWDTFKIAGFKN